MRTIQRMGLLALGLGLTTWTGCGDEGTASEAPAADEALSIVEPGKEDNFLSMSAQEYALTGTTRVTLEGSYAGKSAEERLARARELVPYRQTVIAWFLNAYVQDKGHDATNGNYGGYRSLTKNGSWQDLEIRPVDGDELAFDFDLRQEIGGRLDLLSVLPTVAEADGRRSFELTIGKISTSEMQRLEINNEWYRQSPWESFDPAKVDASRTEKVKLYIAAEPRSVDAWFDYPRLIEDGVLDVGVHFGWDYHKEYHLVHSREVYDTLVRQGFKSPVANYDAYTRTSGPLTKTLKSPKGPFEVRISLYWGKPGTDTDPDTAAGGIVLEDDMRGSLKNRDITVFSGHSGPFYGFALANWRKTEEGDLDDSELSSLEMPADRYQVVLAEGCETYAMGQGFFLNPAKAGRKNLDIVTSTNFSNASTAATVKTFLGGFTDTDANGLVQAPSISTILSKLDSNSSWFSTMYGVHGLDDNPRHHPFADEDKLCEDCGGDAACGGPGNRCVTMKDGARACSYECTADDGCDPGFLCQSTQSGGYLRAKVCVSQQATCESVDAPPVVRVGLLEVFPRPDRDMNGDGTKSSRADETVTLLNSGTGPVDLSGWSLADTVGMRFKFPRGYSLAAGAQVQVFGGGSNGLRASGGLSLNDDGDTLQLQDERGTPVDSLSWQRVRAGAVVRHEE